MVFTFRSKQRIPYHQEKRIWQVATVKSILSNEKYKGEALLQKGFTVDFLTKKRKVNEGEVPQYYVKNSHVSGQVKCKLFRQKVHSFYLPRIDLLCSSL